MSVNCAACGTCYTQTEGTELGGIELQRSRFFFFFKYGGGGGGEVVIWSVCGVTHPLLVPAMALWLTHVKLFCNVVSRFEVF